MKTLIEVSNLKKRFGKIEALKDVSLKLDAGQVLGFIGPNGAGKSTTIRILLGFIQRDEGQARIFGKDVWKDSFEIHKSISYVPGDLALWGNLSGGEIIDLFLKLHGKGNRKRRDILIDRFDLDTRKKARTYSKGNRQKVALVSALACASDIYIFDEPTSGLDPLMEQVFQEEVKSLKAEGKSVLLSSHILSEVEKLADNIAIIRNGVIVEEGSLEELRHLTRSTIRLSAEKDLTLLNNIAGVYDFFQSQNEAVFSVDPNKLNEILQEVTKLGVRSMEISPPTLEDLFMRHYKN